MTNTRQRAATPPAAAGDALGNGRRRFFKEGGDGMHITRDLLLQRLVVADRMLASPAGCCLHQLAAELNVCERTARRVVLFIDKAWSWSGDLAVERTALRRWRYRTRGASIFVRPPRRTPA